MKTLIIIGIILGIGIILLVSLNTLSDIRKQECEADDGIMTGPFNCMISRHDYSSPPLSSESEPESENYQLDEPFEIKMDQRIQFEDLELYFYDIEDSRCPLDVTCVWEGKVAVMLNIKNQTHNIGGGIPPGYTISYFTPYEITLVDIQPHPISTEKAEYVATIKISNLDEKDD